MVAYAYKLELEQAGWRQAASPELSIQLVSSRLSDRQSQHDGERIDEGTKCQPLASTCVHVQHKHKLTHAYKNNNRIKTVQRKKKKSYILIPILFGPGVL